MDTPPRRYRILVLTPQRPHRARQGAAIRNWNLMAQLARRHDLDLLTFLGPDEPGEESATGRGGPGEPWQREVTVRAPRRSWRRRAGVLLLSGRADMADRLWSPAFARHFREMVRTGGYDIVQAEGIELARYLLLLAGLPGEQRPLLVFDDHNAEYVLQRRAAAADLRRVGRWPAGLYSLIQWWRLRALERRTLRACDLTVCVSEADAEAVQALARERPIVVAPNGADTDYYAPEAAPARPPRFDLVFSGTFAYRPNIDAARWFTDAVWPRLRARRRELRLALVGRDPTPEVTRLVHREGVAVTGSVADDRPYFAGATVYILPMRYGGGVRLKLLNALAMGCAVVTTSAGGEGVPLRDGEHLLVADGEEPFAAAIERLLDDPDLRARLGAAGRAFVREHYDWAGIVARLEAAYDAAFKIRSSPAGQPDELAFDETAEPVADAAPANPAESSATDEQAREGIIR